MLLEGVTMKSIRCVFCFRQEHVPQVEGGPIEKIEKYDTLKPSTCISTILFLGQPHYKLDSPPSKILHY